jgi:hypothetical protein
MRQTSEQTASAVRYQRPMIHCADNHLSGRRRASGIRPALIDRDRQDVGVIALAAIEGPDIVAGWSARDAHECHRGAAFGAISTLNGGEREAGERNGLRHQPFNVCVFNHFWFFRSLRRDKAVCRC